MFPYIIITILLLLFLIRYCYLPYTVKHNDDDGEDDDWSSRDLALESWVNNIYRIMIMQGYDIRCFVDRIYPYDIRHTIYDIYAIRYDEMKK